jgi:hypothetical protein
MAKFTYEVTIPNSGSYDIESDRELTDAQAYQYALQQASKSVVTTQAKEPQTQRPLTAGQVATGAVMNFPSSLGKMATDVFKAVTDPLQTARDLGTLFVGTTSKILGEPFLESDLAKQMRLKGEKSAEQMGAFLADRYGSVESAKNALATDPAGVLSDISLLFTGGASLAPKASTVGKVLTKGAEVTNPLNIAAAPIKYGVKSLPSVLGGTTGAGAMAVEEAFKAGKEGGTKGQAFTENMRGTADRLQVLEDTKANLQAMIKQQQDAYRSGMVDIKADQSILSFDDIDKALKNATDRVTYKGKVTNNYGMSKIEEAQKLINDWRNSNPQDFHTPEGLDKLKQSLYDEVIADIPLNKKNTLSAVGDIYNSIKSTIQTQAPTYADTMKQYANTAEQVREIERALSQGKKATADAGMRKLQSVMRDNVNTNYGQRVNLVNQLEATSPQFGGGLPIKPALAGQTMSSGWPRGVQGVGTVGTAGLLSQLSNPMAAAYLAASSPRLVGEASYLAGQGARQAGKVTGLFPELDYPTMFNLLSKAQVQ